MRRRTSKIEVNLNSRQKGVRLTVDGSVCAGSESEPSCGAQPAPIEDATSVGTIVIREGLNKIVAVNGWDTRQMALIYVQGGSLWLVFETSRTALDDEWRRVHTTPT
jgi:hypothetical protein